ncbi:MAG: hypothetical protein AAGG07_04590 [Planctomycetota bacterium]
MNSLRLSLLSRVACCLCAVASLTAAPTRADEHVDRLNGLLPSVAADLRSDLRLLPLFAAMDSPPASLQDRNVTIYVAPDGPGWDAVEAWVQAESQRAVLDAIATVTERGAGFAFALPYGTAGLPQELIDADAVVALGQDELIAGATYGWMTLADRASILVHAEATRLTAAGDAQRALELLWRWAVLMRQVMDRPMILEVIWAGDEAIAALDRMRDVAYLDLKGSVSLSPGGLAEITQGMELAEEALAFERWRLPEGERIAAEQLVNRVLGPGGSNERFGAVLARAEVSDRPLRLIGQAGRWATLAEAHAGRAETIAAINRVYGGALTKWQAPEHSPLLATASETQRIDMSRFGVLEGVFTALRQPETMLGLRLRLRAEAVGTRQALALLGYRIRFGAPPPAISAIRPAWVERLEVDPYNPDRADGARPPMNFYVPSRPPLRSPGAREIVVQGGIAGEFTFKPGPDDWVVYSYGPDNLGSFAERVHQGFLAPPATDLLIWPPATSLNRARLGGG